LVQTSRKSPEETSRPRGGSLVGYGIILLILLVVALPAGARSPKSLIVNGTMWTVARQHDIFVAGRWYDGYTACDQHVIRIADDIGRCYEAVTFFHELEHASVCNQDFEVKQMSGHDAIEQLAFGMSKILADNPKVRAYFNKSRNCSWTDEE